MTRQEAEVILKVNDQQARGKFEELEKQAKSLRAQFADAFKRGDTKAITEINKQLQKVNKEMNNMRTNSANIRAAMVRLDEATPKELRRTIKMINDELNSGRVQRGSEEWQMYVEQLHMVTEELRNVNEEFNNLSEAQGESEGIFDRFAKTMSKWWATYTMVTDGIEYVNEKLASMKQDYQDKDEAKANLMALTGLDDSSIQWLTEQAELLATTMDESGLRITQSSKEILEAYMLVGSNKPELLTDKEALNEVTIESMRLASAASMNLQPAVDAMTTALNQYGEGADQAARYVNVLAAGSKFGASNVEQQAASVLKAGTAAASANVSFEELVGSIEMLGEKGIKGEVAGTGLKKLFLTLQTGAEDTNPKVVGMSTALENLKAKVDAAEQQSVGGGASFLKKMFGEEAYSIASILTENIQKVKEYTDAVTGTETAMEQAAVNSNTTAAKMAQFKNRVQEAGIELIENLNPALDVLETLSCGLITALPVLLNIIKTCAGTFGVLATAILAYNFYLQQSIILDKLKVFWQDKVVAAAKKLYTTVLKHPYAAVAAGVAILIGVLVDLYRAQNKVSAAEKELEGIRDRAKENMVDEKLKLDLLVSAARNETLSLDERKKAINKLNEIVPGYNASLDETSGKYTENKKALDEYNKALARKYELEGAKESLSKIGKEKADAKIGLDAAANETERARKASKAGMGHTYSTSWGYMGNTALDATSKAEADLAKAEKKMEDIKKREEAILNAYGVDLQKSEANETPTTTTTTTTTTQTSSTTSGVDKEQEKLDKLKADLENVKNEYLQLEIQNQLSYISGEEDYTQFLAKKKEIDNNYLKEQVQAHERHNKIDLSGYTSLLAQQTEKKREADAEIRDLEIENIEQKHKNLEDGIVKDFYDPHGTLFQKQVLLNQRLFEEDIRYLEEKKSAFTVGTEEYAEIETEITERAAKDQFEKQKAYAEEINRIRKEYLNDQPQQMQAELDLLGTLHQEGILSEEKYQEAITAVRKKHEEKKEKSIREFRSNEYVQLKRLISDYKDLISSFGGSWEIMLENIAKLADSTFSIVSGYLTLYTNYSNACRDLELANIEKKYDQEIKAAGKNEKKKRKLEEQKEAEVAKVKKKYNDRAMKMELAQAVAQTAVAAINAYASASKVSWLLGPIAAAMALAAGAVQIATIKKQHEAETVGYYDGGFTTKDTNNRKEVGVVHANEFVANHKAVANNALSPVLQLIDHAQRNNTVGSLSALDVSTAIGTLPSQIIRSEASSAPVADALAGTVSLMADISATTRESLDRLSTRLDDGIEAYIIMDGEQGFHKKYEHYKKLIQNPKR